MIHVRNVTKGYSSELVLSNITFNINAGEAVVICGPSGSGKSTLLRIISGLIEPCSGQVLITGRETNRSNFDGKIGLVLQDSFLYSHLTVVNNITLAPRKVKGMTKQAAVNKAKALLQEFDLLDKADNYPHELSGGQKQRISIIRALAMEPDIVLLDEPTSALDTISTKEVISTIKKLRERNCTIVVVTHELGLSRAIADKVICMDKGEIHEISTPHELVTQPRSSVGKSLFSHGMSNISTVDKVKMTNRVNIGIPAALCREKARKFTNLLESKLDCTAIYQQFENITPEVLLRMGIVDIFIAEKDTLSQCSTTSSYYFRDNGLEVKTSANDVIWQQIVDETICAN